MQRTAWLVTLALTTPLLGQTALAEPRRDRVPAPELLPVATTAQLPLTAAYDALGVPALPAGGWYRDPTTGVIVHKLTSASFPASSGALAPWSDLGLSFSNNPTTPHWVYISTNGGSAIRRFDLRTMTEAPGEGWPVTGETQATWLHQSEDDGLFVWLRGANGKTVVGYEPRTGIKKTYTNFDLNEPRIDRAGRYIGMSMNAPQNGLVVWDWQADATAWAANGTVPFAHNASLRRRWLSVDWNMTYPPQFTMFVPDAGVVRHIGGPANASLVHGSGNWIQRQADLDDQWAAFLHYGSLRPPQPYWLAPGGIVMITPRGERRLLAHAYNTAASYTFFSFAKLAPDGRYVLFTSDMNGSGRSDLFLAELPLSGDEPPWLRPAER
jgi:hypothetical protein